VKRKRSGPRRPSRRCVDFACRRDRRL